MKYVTLEMIAELLAATQKGCLYSLAQLEEVKELGETSSSPSLWGLELPSTYHPNGSPREWGDYGDDD